MWISRRSAVRTFHDLNIALTKNTLFKRISYWDWTLDVDSFSRFTESPIWSGTDGFGGNGPFVSLPEGTDPGLIVPGRTGGGCVVDGPFKNMAVRLGPGDSLIANDRCLTRDFSPYYAKTYLGRNSTAQVMKQSDFGWLDRVIEGAPSFNASGVHGGGHFGVGGTLGVMGDLYNSPSGVFSFHPRGHIFICSFGA